MGTRRNRLNSISPGPIVGTEGMRRLASPSEEETAIAAVPLRRLGTPEDIAYLAMFLASPKPAPFQAR